MTLHLHPIAATVYAMSGLCGLAASLPAYAYADDAALPVVTVSAGRGSSVQKMDLATTVLSREQVADSPETTVEQILNKIPGVFVRQEPAGMIHPTGEAFSIRGFGTTTNVNTLVMIDGLPINDPYFRTIDWGQIPKESIERIEVIRGGGASTLWGNLAMGGIVNIVTRRPEPNEKRVNVSYGSFKARAADGAVTLVSTPALTLGVSGGWSESDGYQLTPAQYRSPHMDSTRSRIHHLAVIAYLQPTADSNYYVKLQSHESSADRVPWKISNFQWSKDQLSAGGVARFASAASVQWNAWYNRGEMATTNASATPGFNILQPNVATPFVSQIEQAKYSSTGGSAFYQRDIGNWKEVRIGVDLRQVRGDDHINVYTPASRVAALVNSGDHGFQGVFAQASYRPREVPLDVTIGLREDFFQTRDGGQAGTVNGKPVDSRLADQSFRHFSPRIGAKYYLDGGFNVRGALYRNFAAPGMNQMYRSFVSGTSYTATNPDLQPQTNLGQELGFDYARGGLRVGFTVFNNKLRNFIDYGPLCSTVAACAPYAATAGLPAGSVALVNRYVNAGDAVLRGAELMADWQLNSAVSLHGGVTRTDAHLTDSLYATVPSAAAPAVPVHKQIGQVARWVATAGGSWQATSKLKLSAEVKAFPDYWYNTAHTTLNTGATLVDVGFRYRYSAAVELYGSAQNIGGKAYFDQGLAYTTMEGSTLSTNTVPQRGTPRSATVGMRIAF